MTGNLETHCVEQGTSNADDDKRQNERDAICRDDCNAHGAHFNNQALCITGDPACVNHSENSQLPHAFLHPTAPTLRIAPRRASPKLHPLTAAAASRALTSPLPQNQCERRKKSHARYSTDSFNCVKTKPCLVMLSKAFWTFGCW